MTDTDDRQGAPGLLARATSREALRTSLPAAFLVGTTLTIVNSWTRITHGIDASVALRVAMTYLVPWGNATYGYLRGERRARVT